MRHEDALRIRHMIEAAEAVATFVDGRAREDLDRDRQFLFALQHAVGILGEAASKISPELRANTAEIPWRAMVGMRNWLIHAYFDVNLNIVWKTATEEIPQLLPRLRELLPPDHQ
jgi:uncharacterized protein with HEPN domain